MTRGRERVRGMTELDIDNTLHCRELVSKLDAISDPERRKGEEESKSFENRRTEQNSDMFIVRLLYGSKTFKIKYKSSSMK